MTYGVTPRLLRSHTGKTSSLGDHQDLFSTRSRFNAMVELEKSGLLGRGGAGFETTRKVQLIRPLNGTHKVMVVNAMEGEPASHKDAHLLQLNPHLVLEGAEQLAQMIRASRVIVAVARENVAVIARVRTAIQERERMSRRECTLELVTPPGRYVAGEESALVHWLNDNEALPQFRAQKPTILTVGRRHPVLLDNAETCANVALIARFGAEWFRSVGTASHPGTTLVSVSGGVDRPKVIEVALGTKIRDILQIANATPHISALVVGGYGGLVLGPEVLDLPYSNDGLSAANATVGAGILCPIPSTRCAIAEVHRVVHWMANESARQCGPCAFGLPALAEDLRILAYGLNGAREAVERLHARSAVIEGRGACRHPDGVVRFVRSALATLQGDIAAHREGRPCAGVAAAATLIVPAPVREEEMQWQ